MQTLVSEAIIYYTLRMIILLIITSYVILVSSLVFMYGKTHSYINLAPGEAPPEKENNEAVQSVISGLFVLAQKETPGLGSNITEGPKFRDQFSGKPTSPGLVVNKVGQKLSHEIKPVTSATISSQSVCQIVNAEVARQKARIKRMAAGGPSTLQ